jgi:hypothetical protein
VQESAKGAIHGSGSREGRGHVGIEDDGFLRERA